MTSYFCRELLFRPSVRIWGKTWKHENFSHWEDFVTRFLNRAFQEIKVTLNESRLLKFYQVKQLKENSTENFPEKNFKEDSKLNELWNISTKQKKKRKILQFKELCFLDTLSDKFQQIVLKFATLYLFYPFLSCFICIKFLFKNVVYVIFSNQYPNQKAVELAV